MIEGQTLVELATQIQAESAAKQDFVSDTRSIQVNSRENILISE